MKAMKRKWSWLVTSLMLLVVIEFYVEAEYQTVEDIATCQSQNLFAKKYPLGPNQSRKNNRKWDKSAVVPSNKIPSFMYETFYFSPQIAYWRTVYSSRLKTAHLGT